MQKNPFQDTSIATEDYELLQRLRDELSKKPDISEVPIDLARAARDNNEGNPLTFFNYTFSTGETIDSLYVKGNISDAYDFETDNYVSLQLYRIDSIFKDSIIFKERPTYVANSLDSTLYQFQNLKEGKYLIIALKDVDNNYFFDPFYDKIGFIDSLITLPRD